MREFPELEAPITIRGITIKNRIIAAPTGFTWPDLYSNMPDAHEIFNHEERARGGAAIVEIGETSISRTRSRRHSGGDVLVPDFERNIYPSMGWLKLTDSILRHGAIPSVQLFHAGANTEPQWINGLNPIGPSGFTKPDGTVVEEMDEDMIEKVADEFAEAAWYAKHANFPMIQLHGAHGWLLAQFVSPLTNHRKDKYGGSLENRARFPLLVCKKVRERVGNNFIIEYRMSGDEHLDSGFGADEAVELGRMLEDYVDILHISSGSYYASRQYTFPTIFTPHGCNLHLAEAFKKSGLKAKIVSVGAFSDPVQMNAAIADGKADFIAVCRQLAADPMFPRKVFTGAKDDVVPCTRCINCLGNKYEGRNECDVNPLMGNEIYTLRTPAVQYKRKVLIVGAGPGGMKAAITAAERGHDVILAEKSNSLGGALKFTDIDCHKEDLKRYKDYLIRQVGKHRIEVRLNTEVTREYIDNEKPYAVIASVGSIFKTYEVPGADKLPVLHATAAYYRPDEIGNKVVMIGAGLMGCEIALHLADTGKDVTILARSDKILKDANVIHKAAVIEMLDIKVKTVLEAKVREVTEKGVIIENSCGEHTLILADTVLYAVGSVPDLQTVNNLRLSREYSLFFAIGDCVPGSAITAKGIRDAVHGGYFAAMDIT